MRRRSLVLLLFEVLLVPGCSSDWPGDWLGDYVDRREQKRQDVRRRENPVRYPERTAIR